ncbi:MAG: SH3 domain-containing protein [Thermomicrobiales bacterium]
MPGGPTIYSVSGSSGYPGDPIDDDIPPPPDRHSADPRGRERQLDYYTEERYWTDYVRIGLPILGVILILLVALLWIIPFFGGDDDDDDALGASGTATTTIPVIGPDATPTAQAGSTTTPRIMLTSQPGATTPAGTDGEPTETTAPVEPPPDGDIFNGATVAVANTGGTGVNMRASPSVDGEIVTVVLDGTEFLTTGEAEEADGFLWWPVEGEAGAGYIVADYLILVQ